MIACQKLKLKNSYKLFDLESKKYYTYEDDHCFEAT